MSAFVQKRCPRLGFRSPSLGVLASALAIILANGAVPAYPQDDTTWRGTVEVQFLEPGPLTVQPGASFTYQVRLSEQPTGDGWWIRVHVDGEVRADGNYKEIMWVPSVGWEFDQDNWDEWRLIRIMGYAVHEGERTLAAPGTKLRFTHEVWDHNTNCPVHNVGQFEISVSADDNGGGNGGDGDSGDNGGDGGGGGGGNGGGGNPSLPSLAIDDVTVAENGTNAVFTVRLSPHSDDPVTVAYATEEGTATAGEDYQTTRGTLSFPSGETARTIMVTLLDDSDAEETEDFVVILSNPQNATLLDGEGTAYIMDDDGSGGGDGGNGDAGLPTLAINNVTVNEDGRSAVFSVRLSEASDDQVTVDFATADGTAFAESDYTATNGMLAFPSGETVLTIAVPILDDDEAEVTEEFTVSLGNARNATLLDGEGTATITDDDDGARAPSTPSLLPKLTINDVTVHEYEGRALFRVGLDKESTEAVTVAYATADGSATAGPDYTATSGMFAFQPGETEKTIAVAIHDDDEEEGHETFTVRLSNPRNATLADSEGTATIRDDELAVPVPEGWLREFGRTAVSHVVDALDERMRCARDRQPGAASDGEGSRWRCTQYQEPASFEIDGTLLARLAAAGDASPTNGAHPDLHGLAPADLSARIPSGSLLLASSAKQHNRPGMSVWGRGSYSRFERDDALPLGGDVWTATFGADFAFRQAVAGVALSHSESEGTASQDGVETDVTSVLTGFYPYLRVGLNDRLSVWGTVGLGAGTLIHSMNGAPSLRTGIAMTMAAAGGLAEVVSPTGNGGLSVAIKADGLLLEIESDGSSAVPSAALDASRLRLVLESAYEFVLRDRQRIAPFLEIGGRLDGADAQDASGLGFEVGGGVRYAHPLLHLTAEVYSRALLVHAANGFKGWSASGTLRYDPRSNSAQGPYLTVTSSRGFGGLGGQVALGLAGLTKAAAFEDGDAGWGVDTEFGYGVPIPGGAATGTPWAGLSLSQGRPEYRLGYRLEYETGLHLSLAATLRDGYAAHEPPRYLLTLLLSLR